MQADGLARCFELAPSSYLLCESAQVPQSRRTKRADWPSLLSFIHWPASVIIYYYHH